ncbi:MAG TPA: helix-turn-helix domain-containing protein [Acidimicrobiales bacterium]|nr:helix-turn-helix domain-containing protein [Acidimicrobiales bacterium]
MSAHNHDPAEATLHQPFTVASLLDEPLLRASAAAGGSPGDWERRVEWSLPLSDAMAEGAALDGVVVVDRGDLLGSEQALAAEQVRRLHEGGAAALIVLAGAGRQKAARELAESAGLPVIVAPPDIGFPAINRLVAEKRLAQDAHAMAYGVSVHRELADVLYRGSGLSAMARRISRLSNCPAFLLDTNFDVLAYESLSAAAVPDPEELVRVLRQQLASEQPGPGGHTGARCLEVQLEQQTVSVVVDPMVLGGTTYGWVVIVEFDHPPNRHDLAQHLVVAEQAVMITGSEILRLRSIEESEERARGDFVHALLHGRFTSAHELASRAAHHHFDVDGVYAVVAVRGVLDAATAKGLSRSASVVRTVQQLSDGANTTMATPLGDLLVVVRKVAPAGRSRTGAPLQEAGEFASALMDLLGSSGAKPAVAVGRPGKGVTGIMNSYREARVALEVARSLRFDGVANYGDLRVFAVLAHVAQEADGKAFADETFAPLRGPVDRGEDLEAVLMAYIESGGNLNAAARNLYMHRNTVLYKLDKASRLLGMDIRQAENQFTIWLAHRIRVLSEAETAVAREIGPFA